MKVGQSSLSTNKSNAFDDPSGGTMEAAVITRNEVDDTGEKNISGPDAGSRSSVRELCALPSRPQYSTDLSKFSVRFFEFTTDASIISLKP